ncbi:MFS transporter [Williamsia sp. MIQD14]|uniref:MFS transporter n=1 Tax=Williamsia sp. MIQD14 TaxID=3425703 RepID=UPI003DA09B72
MNIVYPEGRSTASGSRHTLAVACIGQLMVVIDGLIVTIALPDIRSDMELSAATQGWVVNAYLLAFGALLLVASRAADRLGHRKVFTAGVVVFTLASLCGGLAPGAGMLVAARVAQGIGAAAIAPTSLSLLTTTFTGDARSRALSAWSATSAVAGAGGLVVGGVITAELGWRWVFLANVPLGVAVFALTAALPAVAGTVEAPPSTPYPWRMVLRRSIVVANVSMAVLGAAMTAALYCLSLFLQNVQGRNPLQTGSALLPMSAVLALGAVTSPRLLARWGTTAVTTTGTIVAAAGAAALTMSMAFDHGPAVLIGATLVWACGAGVLTMPIVSRATADVPPAAAGLASGTVSVARQIGGVLGVAAIAALGVAPAAGIVH